MFSYSTYWLSTFTGNDCLLYMTRNVMRNSSLIKFPCGFSLVKRVFRVFEFFVCSQLEFFHTLCCPSGSTIDISAAKTFFPLLSDYLVYTAKKSPYSPKCGAVGSPFVFLRISDCLLRISTCKFVFRICH